MHVVWPACERFHSALNEALSSKGCSSHVRADVWLDYLAEAQAENRLIDHALFISSADAEATLLIAATRMNSAYTGFPITQLTISSNEAKVEHQTLTSHLQLAQDLSVIKTWLSGILVRKLFLGIDSY